MKIKWYIVFFVWVMMLASCTREIIYDRSNLPEGMLFIEAYPRGFDQKKSRAGKNKFEFKVTNKCLLIFDSQGKIATKPQYAEGQDAAFMINRYEDFKLHGQDFLDQCKIYVVANLPESTFANVTDTTSLNSIQVKAEKSSIHLEKLVNYDGLPMIGHLDSINLQTNASDLKIAAPIKLNTLYAKVVVDIKMEISQSIVGHIPYFVMDSWQVKNLPDWATLGAPKPEEETACKTYYTPKPEMTISAGTKEITDGRGHIQFEFYTLERKLNPAHLADTLSLYPEGIKDNEKQRFKPLVCDTVAQQPMYIEVKGFYWDHQKHPHNVTYKIYLGENNKNDFNVNRNCQLNNNVYIRGVSKNDKGDPKSISFDCRVNSETEDQDFTIKIERETMLDSHTEIRPIDIDIELKTDTAQQVVVQLINPNDSTIITETNNAGFNWVRFEKKSHAEGAELDTWCSNGKRKYFTNTLMQDLKDFTETITQDDIKNNNARVWVYFDENLYASTDKMRSIIVRFNYFEAAGRVIPEGAKPTKVIDYEFMQHDLYPVKTVDGKTYYIEFYEEYLYNFDPKDPFNNRTDGMKWGPDGLMSENPAIDRVGNQGIIDEIINALSGSIKELGGKYDYYEPYIYKDPNTNEPVGPAGIEYTKKLLKAGNNLDEPTDNFLTLPLDQQPRSAAEYCANKNNRNADGTLDLNNLGWYLPAIGELQDITKAAYAKFKVFQNQDYWSSQPSYSRGKYVYDVWGVNRNGWFYIEDHTNARVTRTEINSDGTFGFLGSDVTDGWDYVIKKTSLTGKAKVDYNDKKPMVREPGNFPRSDIKRVRAVRSSIGVTER